MAENDSVSSKPQRVASSKFQENDLNSSKFYTHFLYKAIIVSIFLVILPHFPSQPPEFINQTLHTRSWELLQLIFVGIAVSYGLFSKRNDEIDKYHSSNFDNAQSYVSGLLQVPSVFGDETENPSGDYENKVQTWSSHYYRGEPMVVVSPETSVLEENRVTSSRIVEKPLLFPFRSLKSNVSDPNVIESNDCINKSSSILGSKRFSRNSSNSSTGEFGGVDPLELEGKVEENVVLPSPIPWRSRSGRVEMKEGVESPFSVPPSMEEYELNKPDLRSYSSQSSRSSRTNSTSPSPKKLSPSPSLTSEIQNKNLEDLTRRKSFHKSAAPPPPPPPPPQPFLRKPTLAKSNSSVEKDEFFPQKEFKHSIKSVPKELNGSDREDDFLIRGNSGEGAEWWQRTSSDGSLKAKSVRTIKPIEPIQREGKAREFSEKYVYNKEEKKANEVQSTFKIINENVAFVSKQIFSEFPTEEKKAFLVEEVLMETDDDSNYDEDDEFEEISVNDQEIAQNSAGDEGPDVDKKADEFIAKFREQIRLQRIAAIRGSTGEVPRKSEM